MGEETFVVIEEIRKRFGEGAIARLGKAPNMEVGSIPTGSLALDAAIGIGGVPLGRITEIFGPDMSGKTTLCQHIIAEAQKKGHTCAFIDMEHALDLSYAKKTGVNVDELYLAQPDSGEQALEILEMLVRSDDFTVIIVDSVAALVPTAEIEGDMGDSVMGMQARLMSQAMRKLSGVIRKSNSAVIFTNQLRMKIGVVYGNPEVTTGGRALKFYASLRIDLRRKETLKVGATVIGNEVRARVVKNKVAPPFRTAKIIILYDKGISKIDDLLFIGTGCGVLDKKGSYYYYGNTRLGHGKEKVREYFEEYPEMLVEIEGKIREMLGI